jgi:hypothetical protein
MLQIQLKRYVVKLNYNVRIRDRSRGLMYQIIFQKNVTTFLYIYFYFK